MKASTKRGLETLCYVILFTGVWFFGFWCGRMLNCP